MDFLNPPLLWGTLGVAIPIVIHLLNRLRFKRIDWAAMELLRRAMTARARRIRIEDLLLLFLRCLAVLLIALAFARLTLTPSGGPGLSGQPDVGVVVAIDGSFSMAHRPGVRSRFESAIDRAREVLETIEPGAPLGLVLMGQRPHVLLRNVGYDKARVEKALEGADTFAERLNLEAGLERIEELARELKAPSRECFLITDAQANTWKHLSDKVRASLERLSAVARVFVLPSGASGSENLALTRLALASGALRKGAIAKYDVEIRNAGKAARRGSVIHLALDGQTVAEQVVERLEAGQSQFVPLYVQFPEAGNIELSARIEDDDLLIDNVRFAVASVREQVRILCVDGDPAPAAYERETGYLIAALDAVDDGSFEDGVFVHAVPWPEFSGQRLSDYHIVMLANVGAIDVGQTATLYNFVRDGGGLVVFVGDNVDAELLNSRMRHRSIPLLPGALGEVMGEEGRRGQGWSISPAGADHPLSRAVGSLKADLLDSARVYRYFRVDLTEGARELLRITGAGSPLLCEKRLGLGKVLLFSTTADRAWADMVAHPIFPVVVYETITCLTREDHELPRVVGVPTSVSLPADAEAGRVPCLDPRGSEFSAEVTMQDGQAVAELSDVSAPGFCQVRYLPSAPPTRLAFNVDSMESDVGILEGDELAAAVARVPVTLIGAGEDVSTAVKESRVGRELWWELLAAALGILCVESLLAHRFARRAAAHGA